jgi:hypothetical protein
MTSRMHLKDGRRAGNGAYTGKGNTSRVMVGCKPKVSFWPDGRTSSGNYGWLFVFSKCNVNEDVGLQILWAKIGVLASKICLCVAGERSVHRPVCRQRCETGTSELDSKVANHERNDSQWFGILIRNKKCAWAQSLQTYLARVHNLALQLTTRLWDGLYLIASEYSVWYPRQQRS